MRAVIARVLLLLGCGGSDGTTLVAPDAGAAPMSRRPLFPPVFEATHSHPLVDDFTLRAARLQAKQPVAIPPVYPIPLRNHPLWSGSNEIGNESAFAPDANNRQTILKMEEWGPPKIWTVCLGLRYDKNNSPDPAFSIIAEIQFGSGGSVQTVEVDWKQGAAITIPANTIVVNASYPLEGEINASVPTDLALIVTVSEQASSHAAPSRSYRTLLPITESASIVPVPSFAKDVFVQLAFETNSADPFVFATTALLAFRFGTDATPAATPVVVNPATQFIGWLDFTNQLVGYPVAVPVPEGARSLMLVWAPAGVPTPPIVPFVWVAQFGIGL